jgi:hypothetical protein
VIYIHLLVTEGGVDEKEGRVCYRDGKEVKELETMDYLEFIARVTSHIPDTGSSEQPQAEGVILQASFAA